MISDECVRCGKKLTGKQKKYCSKQCMKSFLKSLWQKRNRDKAAQYNREWRARKQYATVDV
jgi:hypothetical protein